MLNCLLGQWKSGASQVLVVGKDNSISIKTVEATTPETHPQIFEAGPETGPHVVVEKWPPPPTPWDTEKWQEEHWQNQELLRQEHEQDEDTWSIDLSKPQQPQQPPQQQQHHAATSILDKWHQENQ